MLFLWFEHIGCDSAQRTSPVRWQFFKWSAGGHSVFRISDCGIINISADCANIFFSFLWFYLNLVVIVNLGIVIPHGLQPIFRANSFICRNRISLKCECITHVIASARCKNKIEVHDGDCFNRFIYDIKTTVSAIWFT